MYLNEWNGIEKKKKQKSRDEERARRRETDIYFGAANTPFEQNNAMHAHGVFVDIHTNKRTHAFIKQLTSKWNLY